MEEIHNECPCVLERGQRLNYAIQWELVFLPEKSRASNKYTSRVDISQSHNQICWHMVYELSWAEDDEILGSRISSVGKMWRPIVAPSSLGHNNIFGPWKWIRLFFIRCCCAAAYSQLTSQGR